MTHMLYSFKNGLHRMTWEGGCLTRHPDGTIQYEGDIRPYLDWLDTMGLDPAEDFADLKAAAQDNYFAELDALLREDFDSVVDQ
ncbi:hypothetical protein [Azospirillum sp. sgz301742]